MPFLPIYEAKFSWWTKAPYGKEIYKENIFYRLIYKFTYVKVVIPAVYVTF